MSAPAELEKALAYPTRVLVIDYLRSGAGLAVSGGLLLSASLPAAANIVLAAVVLLFLAYGLRSLCRHFSRIRLSEQGISATGAPFGATLLWRDVTGLRLRYYSTRRDRRNGWLQLNLDGKNARLRIVSDLDDFQQVAARAAAAADANGLILDRTTKENLSSMGISAVGRLA